MIDLSQVRETKKAFATNQLKFYDPYPYQEDFNNQGKEHPQRLLMAANRIGKTWCGAFEVACHLTGRYPDWWQGFKFTRPIKCWAAGINNNKTRDIVQAKLLGPPGNKDEMGTGTIPLECLGETVRKPGVPNALEGAYVKHITGGWSFLGIKSYEMEAVGFMGEPVDLIWLDEEPKQAIYTQCITRTLDTKGIVMMTFTPENGVTEVVGQFMNDLKPGQILMTATWDDASEHITTRNGVRGHITDKVRDQILAAYPPHEREMRSKGIPALGSGLVYPIEDEELYYDPFPKPDHFRFINGIDFGFEHPTAVAFCAFDPDAKVFYVYDVYKKSHLTYVNHASAVIARGKEIVTSWPHDGYRRDGKAGPTEASQYKGAGVNMHYSHFTNPPGPGQKEGQGGNSLEPGVLEILAWMQEGRFKVAKHLGDWFSEKRMYHRKEGVIVPIGDDLMQATRYAFRMRRFARNKLPKKRVSKMNTEYNVFA